MAGVEATRARRWWCQHGEQLRGAAHVVAVTTGVEATGARRRWRRHGEWLRGLQMPIVQGHYVRNWRVVIVEGLPSMSVAKRGGNNSDWQLWQKMQSCPISIIVRREDCCWGREATMVVWLGATSPMGSNQGLLRLGATREVVQWPRTTTTTLSHSSKMVTFTNGSLFWCSMTKSYNNQVNYLDLWWLK